MGGDSLTLECTFYAEPAANEVLEPEHALQPDQIAYLQALGWKTSPITPNFYRQWQARNDDERLQIAREIVRTFGEVYRVPPEQLIEVRVVLLLE